MCPGRWPDKGLAPTGAWKWWATHRVPLVAGVRPAPSPAHSHCASGSRDQSFPSEPRAPQERLPPKPSWSPGPRHQLLVTSWVDQLRGPPAPLWTPEPVQRPIGACQASVDARTGQRSRSRVYSQITNLRIGSERHSNLPEVTQSMRAQLLNAPSRALGLPCALHGVSSLASPQALERWPRPGHPEPAS